MEYGVYKGARNASWQCLIDCGVTDLPVHPIQIAARYGIQCRYAGVQMLKGTSGSIVIVDKQVYICVSHTEPLMRQRYTVLHELGHYLLGHLGDTPLSRSESECRPAEEQAADHFAIGVLAPACVLWGLDLHTAEDIARVCGISIQAAQIRTERMKLLRRRGMFLSHPLERRVYEQFRGFVERGGS